MDWFGISQGRFRIPLSLSTLEFYIWRYNFVLMSELQLDMTEDENIFLCSKCIYRYVLRMFHQDVIYSLIILILWNFRYSDSVDIIYRENIIFGVQKLSFTQHFSPEFGNDKSGIYLCSYAECKIYTLYQRPSHCISSRTSVSYKIYIYFFFLISRFYFT